MDIGLLWYQPLTSQVTRFWSMEDFGFAWTLPTASFGTNACMLLKPNKLCTQWHLPCPNWSISRCKKSQKSKSPSFLHAQQIITLNGFWKNKMMMKYIKGDAVHNPWCIELIKFMWLYGHWLLKTCHHSLVPTTYSSIVFTPCHKPRQDVVLSKLWRVTVITCHIFFVVLIKIVKSMHSISWSFQGWWFWLYCSFEFSK